MAVDYFWRADDYHSYHKTERFTLLVLAPGEIYFEDFSVFYYPIEKSEDEAFKRKQKGRLKLCSKSLVFDPIDSSYPMLKLQYKDLVSIGKWDGSLLSRLASQGDILMVETKQCIQMKESGLLGPYKHIREKKKHLFSLNFGSLSTTLPLIEQLHRASTLNPHDEASMIATIVQSIQARTAFNTSWIEDLYEKIILEVTGEKITPLVCNPGKVLLTSSRLYFQPFNNVEPLPVIKVKLSDVSKVIKRRYLLRHVGLEISSSTSNRPLYLVFESEEIRNSVYNRLLEQEDLSLEESEQENMLLKWQAGAISNFDYLMYLNSQADRSLNDITQYPVFPWVIRDYESDHLDLEDPKTFRDLSIPIGAIDKSRLQQLKVRSKSMPEPKFLYGSHYSTPGFVLYYLVRVAPEYMLCLQNGRFDKADRLFNSIKSCWDNCCTGHSDFKELIPEFYSSDGKFLQNRMNLQLGTRQDGVRVHHVALPPWANDAKDYIQKSRDALECSYVSENIHHWIDLIFGYKQRGEEAWKADNVFYYLTYEGAVDLDTITNPNEQESLKQQILEFGQTPKQLFMHPHPHRKAQNIPHPIPLESLLDTDELAHHGLNEEDIPVIEVKLEDIDSSQNLDEKKPLEDLCNLKLVRTMKSHKDAVLGLSISEKEDNIFSVSLDSQLKMNSLEDGTQIRGMNLSSMALSCCVLMPNSDLVLVGSWDNNLYVYSVDFGRAIFESNIHNDAVSSMCWKNNILVTASWDSTVKVWFFDPKQFSKKRGPPELQGELDHDTEVTAVDLHVDGDEKLIVSGTKDGHIFLWNLDSMVLRSQHWNGQRILSCSEDQFMKVIDVDTGLEIYSKDIDQPIRSASSDGQLVVAGVESGDVVIWDLIKMNCVNTIKLSEKPIRSIGVSAKSNIVVAGSDDGHVFVLKPAGSQL
eukprot:gene1333-15731_t